MFSVYHNMVNKDEYVINVGLS